MDENLYNILKVFDVKRHELQTLMSAFSSEMDQTLSTSDDDRISMLDTHIETIPDGTEQETILSLDIGGTNLRVCMIKLLGNRRLIRKTKLFQVGKEKKKFIRM